MAGGIDDRGNVEEPQRSQEAEEMSPRGPRRLRYKKVLSVIRRMGSSIRRALGEQINFGNYMDQVDAFHQIMRPWVYGVVILFGWLMGGAAHVQGKMAPKAGSVLLYSLGILGFLFCGFIGFGVPYSRTARRILLIEPQRWREAPHFFYMAQAFTVGVVIFLIARPFIERIVRWYDFWP